MSNCGRTSNSSNEPRRRPSGHRQRRSEVRGTCRSPQINDSPHRHHDLQTFPFVLEQLDGADLSGKSWAVIIDESLYTHPRRRRGEMALRQAIGAGADIDDDLDAETALAAVLTARDPKQTSPLRLHRHPEEQDRRTVRHGRRDGNKDPSTCIRCGIPLTRAFILDVLGNYTTFLRYRPTTSDEVLEREVEVGKAGSALRLHLGQASG